MRYSNKYPSESDVTLTRMSAGARIYTECLSHRYLGHGYPLYIPVINANAGRDSGQVDGGAISDVGIVRPEGDVRSESALRARGVKANFSPRDADSSGVLDTADDVISVRPLQSLDSGGSRNNTYYHCF